MLILWVILKWKIIQMKMIFQLIVYLMFKWKAFIPPPFRTQASAFKRI